jgi:hypothetical protein
MSWTTLRCENAIHAKLAPILAYLQWKKTLEIKRPCKWKKTFVDVSIISLDSFYMCLCIIIIALTTIFDKQTLCETCDPHAKLYLGEVLAWSDAIRFTIKRCFDFDENLSPVL